MFLLRQYSSLCGLLRDNENTRHQSWKRDAEKRPNMMQKPNHPAGQLIPANQKSNFRHHHQLWKKAEETSCAWR
ncbi:unnamed protein product [Linum trigynum]|uniref:Uncharacterized protein n=1 Tax=Linum trigynum TaxID=586398 RepID=A0AAV2EXC1_9ROSI